LKIKRLRGCVRWKDHLIGLAGRTRA
jgi:hypothetical protein